MAVGVWGEAYALQADVSVHSSVEYDSNVSQTTKELERSNTAYQIGADFYFSKQSARLSTRADFSIKYEENNTSSDRIQPRGYYVGELSLIPRRLTWTLEDVALQTRIDPNSASSVSNTTNTNTFTTGPDWVIPLSARDTLRLQSRYEKITYNDVPTSDRERTEGSLRWTRAFSRVWSAGLVYSYSDEGSLGRNGSNFQIENRQANVRRSGPRFDMSVALGEAQFDNQTKSTDTSQVDFRYRLNSRTSVFMNYAKRLDTDINSTLSFLSRRLGDISFLGKRCIEQAGSATQVVCDQLPGVQAHFENNVWVLDRDELGMRLPPESIAFSYLGTFNLNNAAFETENAGFGVNFQLSGWGLRVDYSVSEQTEFIANQALGVSNVPDVFEFETVTVSIDLPSSGKLSSVLRVSRRDNEATNLQQTDRIEEQVIALNSRLNFSHALSFNADLSYTEAEDTEVLQGLAPTLENSDGYAIRVGLDYAF